MAQPVVVTAQVAAGLSARAGVELEVAHDAAEFADKVSALLDPQQASRMGAMARSHVLRDYTWLTSYALLDELLQRGGAAPRAAGRGMAGSAPCALAAS